MKHLILPLFFLLSFSVQAQFGVNAKNIDGSVNELDQTDYSFLPSKRKLFQRNHGIIIGLQKGKSTAIEFGGEAHWRKLALVKPHIIGATANMEYNFGDHVVGYKAGMWMKRGRINFTYGGNLTYFNDFKGLQRFGAGPSIGFRFAGFHLVNGYNFLGGDRELDKINTLYMTLRYYFSLENKFTWDRKTMKKKRQKERDRDERKKTRAKEKEQNEKKSLKDIFRRD